MIFLLIITESQVKGGKLNFKYVDLGWVLKVYIERSLNLLVLANEYLSG